MSAGEGRFAKGRGISIPVNIDGVKKKKKGERKGNRDDDFEKNLPIRFDSAFKRAV